MKFLLPLSLLVCICSSYMHQLTQQPMRVRFRSIITTELKSSSSRGQLLREAMELRNVSSIFLLNATRFGLDLALADGLKSLGDFEEAEKFANEVLVTRAL